MTSHTNAPDNTVSLWSRQFIVCFLLLCYLIPAISQEVTPGQSFGAKTSEVPDWFKESFLDFEEDIAEARAQGKRVMLYFHQDSCPYCARLVKESFNDPQTEAYLRKHFDAITINLWGDREVVTVGGQEFTEKAFSAALRVQYTPTLLFLNEQGRQALRLDGYYPRDQFLAALRYVAEHREGNISFSSYMLGLQKSSSAKLIDEAFFISSDRLDQLSARSDGPLAVYFESGDCDNCRILHRRILADAATRQLVVKMQNVQFDINSSTRIVTPGGKPMELKQWVRELGIVYTPSVVFFDASGVEVMRIGAFMKTFHFQSVYDYVLQKAYLSEPSFQRYIAERAEKIRDAGFNTDIWGYESAHN
ncbi:MAG: thioredoxin fold domain-containing protein [Gammaproteobacteria bacterium]|nr:thioredoxin fold domain-containing protein [Gammaproteobacteria bacterium]